MILKYIFLALIISLLSGCIGSSGNDGIHLDGKVFLDSAPVKDAKISVYPYNLNYTEFEQLRQSYPQVGTKITEEMTQDFTVADPLAVVFSDKNGNWKAANLEPGEYFVVITVNKAMVINSDRIASEAPETFADSLISPVILNPDTTITDSVIVNRNQTLFVHGNVTFDEFSTLLVKEGAYIVFSDGDYGSLKIKGKADLIGSADNFIKCIGENLDDGHSWKRIEIGESAVTRLKNVCLYNSMDGIRYLKAKVDIEDCLFYRNRNYSIQLEIPYGGKISNNIFYKYYKKGIGAKQLNVDTIKISNNLFVYGDMGAELYNNGTFILDNNIFSENNCGISAGLDCSGIIKNNYFYKNDLGLHIIGDPQFKESNLKYNLIIKNEFEKNRNSDIGLGLYPGFFHNYAQSPDPVIKYNNFYSLKDDFEPGETNGYNIFKRTNSYFIDTLDNDCTENWWTGETEPSEIAKRIYDYFDEPKEYNKKVIFLPVSKDKFNDAGIQ